MKAYKLEVLITDECISSVEEAMDLIDETRYPNHINVSAVTCLEADIGEWHDDHPLNFGDNMIKAMDEYFPRCN